MFLGVAAFVGALWGGWTLRANNSLNIDLDLIWIRIPNVELWWVLLVAMGVGAIITLVLTGFGWMKARLLLRNSRSRVRKLEKEIHQLRSLPLVGSEPGGENLDASGSRQRNATRPASAGKRG